MPPPRSSTTCSQCRARKVKCDGGPNPCSNCIRLSFGCSFAATSPVGAAAGFSTSPVSGPGSASSRPERRRGTRACAQCRSQKSRCSGELPTCAACRARAKECVYPDLKRPQRRVHGSSNVGESVSPISPHVLQSSPSDAGSLSHPPPATTAMASLAPVGSSCSPNDSLSNSSFNLPPVRDQLHLINDFFRHLHPSPVYSFLSEMPVTQRCLDGTLDETLLLAMCAISALHLGYAKYHPLATASWAQRAEDAIWARIERPSVFGVQALLLVVRYRVETGSFQRAYMLFALAARAASALRLQYERIDLSHLAQEVRRRLMWCLMLLDSQFASGLPESEMCSHESIYVKLPCREEEFHGDGDGDLVSSSLDGVPEDGLLATYIRLSMMRRDVMRLMRQIRLAGEPTSQLVDLVDEFARSLQQLAVPPYTKHDLERYARSRWLVRYVTLHLSWHQAHCDAYRLFLPGYREAAPAVVISEYPATYIQMAARLCLHHARANIAILTNWAAMGSFPVAAPHDISICGYHASRLVLFLSRWPILLPSESDEPNMTPEDASSQANSVLTICKRLHGNSPLINHLVRDLEAVIQAHAAGEPEHSSSDPDDDGAQTRQPRFAVTVQRHKSLGVHSILRRARFVDDSADEGPPKPAYATDTAPHPPSMADVLGMGTSTFDSLVRASSFAETQTPLETSLDTPLFPITGEPFDFGSWDSWADLSWQTTTFSPRSDADYL